MHERETNGNTTHIIRTRKQRVLNAWRTHEEDRRKEKRAFGNANTHAQTRDHLSQMACFRREEVQGVLSESERWITVKSPDSSR